MPSVGLLVLFNETRIALHWIALHWIALHCIPLHCIAMHCLALHCLALHCNAMLLWCTIEMKPTSVLGRDGPPTAQAVPPGLFWANLSVLGAVLVSFPSRQTAKPPQIAAFGSRWPAFGTQFTTQKSIYFPTTHRRRRRRRRRCRCRYRPHRPLPPCRFPRLRTGRQMRHDDTALWLLGQSRQPPPAAHTPTRR